MFLRIALGKRYLYSMKATFNSLLILIIVSLAFGLGFQYGQYRPEPLVVQLDPLPEAPEVFINDPRDETIQTLTAELEALKKANKRLETDNNWLKHLAYVAKKKLKEAGEPAPQPVVAYHNTCQPVFVQKEVPATYNHHRLSALLGYGIKGARTETDGTQVWSEPIRGFVGGFQYQYTFDPASKTPKNIGIGTIGAETVFGSFGLDF